MWNLWSEHNMTWACARAIQSSAGTGTLVCHLLGFASQHAVYNRTGGPGTAALQILAHIRE